MKKNVSLFIAFLSICSITFAQINVFHVNSQHEPPSKNGSFYVLPRTVLTIDVIIRVEEKMKGPYSEYAEKYLGLEEVINFDFSVFSIENIQISTSTEPDPKQVYFAELGFRDSKTFNTLKLELNSAGFLIAANNFNTHDAEINTGTKEIVVFDNPSDGQIYPDFYINPRISTKTDTIIRRVAVDTATAEQLFYRNRVIDKSTEEMALGTLGKIESIRESRYKLLTGFQETTYETGTMKYMDGELKNLENEYLDLFRGKIFTEYLHYTFYFTPESSDKKTITTLFKFSTGSGIIENRGGSGEDIQIEITPNGLEQPAGNFPQANPDNGIAYRLPGYAVISIKNGDKVLLQDRLRINQLGVIKRLPAEKFSAEFHPETGGIRSVVFE